MSLSPSQEKSSVLNTPDTGSTPETAYADRSRWLSRVWAKVIDSAIIWIPFSILWFAGSYFAKIGQPNTATLLYTLSCIEGFVGWIWVVYQVGTTGQSIGKRIIGIRLVSEIDSQPIGFGHAFLHETAQLFFDMLPLGIGYLWPLVDPKRQTFSDKILHTKTIAA